MRRAQPCTDMPVRRFSRVRPVGRESNIARGQTDGRPRFARCPEKPAVPVNEWPATGTAAA